MPLEDLLHAYRLGSRIGWNALEKTALAEERPALLYGAELLWTTSTGYRRRSRRPTSRAPAPRLRGGAPASHLLDTLLDGGTLPAELRTLAEQLGLPLSDRYRPFAAAVQGAPARRHSELASALRAIVASSRSPRASASPGSRPTPPGRSRSSLGPDVVLALAAPTPRATLATALDDMRLLADLGRRLGRTGTVAVDELLPELLLAAPRVSPTRSATACWIRSRRSAATGRGPRQTLAAFVDASLDRRLAAERLHVHPNTLDYRLRQVQELTGLDVHRPEDLVLVMLALRQRELNAAL